ncbi:MAG: hypothetical protein KDD61_03430 [Bdellovibrionales bacterium]|nr:hypothetical protein [Bdellovibrionales bacterium]
MKTVLIVGVNTFILLFALELLLAFAPRMYSEHYFYKPKTLPKSERMRLKDLALSDIVVEKYRKSGPKPHTNYSLLDFTNAHHATYTTLRSESGLRYSIPQQLSSKRASVTTHDGTIIYDVTYQYDKQGRRDQGPYLEKANNFFVLLGGSFVFGQGVEGHESLPGQLKSKFPRANVYNLGDPGTSIAQALYKTMVIDGHVQYQNFVGTKGHVIYLLPGFHPFRFFNSVHQFVADSKWAENQPHFSWLESQQQIRYNGSYKDYEPLNTKLKSLAAHLNLFKKTGFSWPILGEKEYTLYAQSIREVERRLKLVYDIKSFVVVVGFSPKPTGITQSIIPYLKKEGLTLFDYTAIPFDKIMNQQGQIPLDGHPSALAYAFLGDLIYRDLLKLDPTLVTDTQTEEF